MAPKKSVATLFCNAMKELISNDTCKWCAAGGFMRFFGGYSIGFFLPKSHKTSSCAPLASII